MVHPERMIQVRHRLLGHVPIHALDELAKPVLFNLNCGRQRPRVQYERVPPHVLLILRNEPPERVRNLLRSRPSQRHLLQHRLCPSELQHAEIVGIPEDTGLHVRAKLGHHPIVPERAHVLDNRVGEH